MPDVPAPKDAASGNPVAASAPLRRTKARRVIIGLVVLAAIGAGALAYWFMYIRGKVSTDDARIAGRMVDVSPQVPGHITKLLVKAGDRVTKGQLLFTLDTRSLEARVAMAKAAVATAQTGVDLARDQLEKALHGTRKAQIASARAAEQRGAAQRDLAKTTWERDQKLFSERALTKASLDRSHAEYEAAEAAHQQALQSLRLLEQGTRSEDIDAARTAVKIAEGKVEQARASLDAALVAVGQASVAAPFQGVIVRRWLEVGAAAAPGRAVLTLFDPRTLRVDANIEEKNLRSIEIGDRVDIDVDAYPNLHLEGRVSRILQATNSEFSLIPAAGVSGTFIKVAQRIPIQIEIAKPPAYLGPGLSVEINIHTGTAPAAGPRVSADRHP